MKKVSGMTIREYAHKHIFKPLNMNNTFFNDNHSFHSTWGLWFVIVLFGILAASVFSSFSNVNEPVTIILDTDMDTDCDDAGALAVFHNLNWQDGKYKNRSSWDQLSLLYAIDGAADRFEEKGGQKLEFFVETGQHRWSESEGGVERIHVKRVAEPEVLAEYVEKWMIGQ